MTALACLDGPNGAGKTTLRRAIAKALRALGATTRSVDDRTVERSARLVRSYSRARGWFVRRAARAGADVVLVERGLASHIVFDHASSVGRPRMPPQCLTCTAHDPSCHWVLLGSQHLLATRLGRRYGFEASVSVSTQARAFAQAARLAGIATLKLRTPRQRHIVATRIAVGLLEQARP